MSSESDQIRALAERVARRLATSGPAGDARVGGNVGGGGADIDALRAGLDEIQRRLAHVESHVNHDDSCETSARSSTEQARGSREHAHSRRREGETDERGAATPSRSLWLSGTYMPATAHPSEERFGVDEAVSEMVDFFEREKTCNLEPGGKPCDHCGMCSSRGF